MQEGTLLACNSNWLDDTQERRVQTTLTTTSGITTYGTTGTYIGQVYYPYYSNWYVSSYTPVTLKLSEVEYLRKQAKNDKKLKEILQKFTHLIQIVVDFD
jgi:hypothetical protein